LGIRHGDVVARAHDEELRDLGAEHEARRAVEPPVGVEAQLAPEADGADPRAVRQARQPLRPQRLVAPVGDERGRQHGGKERARRHREAQRLQYDRELGQSEALAAVGLVDGKTHPAELGHRLPEARQLIHRRFEQRAGLGPRLVRFEEGTGDACELLVLLGEGDRHGSSGCSSRGPPYYDTSYPAATSRAPARREEEAPIG
jgi:hypothetical protein